MTDDNIINLIQKRNEKIVSEILKDPVGFKATNVRYESIERIRKVLDNPKSTKKNIIKSYKENFILFKNSMKNAILLYKEITFRMPLTAESVLNMNCFAEYLQTIDNIVSVLEHHIENDEKDKAIELIKTLVLVGSVNSPLDLQFD